MSRCHLIALSLALGLLSIRPAESGADVIVIDSTTAGTLIDGLLDGFPNAAPFDGNADFAGNAFAVALKNGVTEERGIAELPLQSLGDAGLTSADIQSAVLSFNIDDVLSTFGPGTSFDGTAAETIILFGYAGNGAIDLADFQNVAGAPLGIVDTTAHGVITDASLATTGPLLFTVDVTSALKAHLDAAHAYMGVVWATNDSPTGTSLDNLGPGSGGPPGVGGATLPFLTITTVSDEPPVFGKSALKCQKALAVQAGNFVKGKQKNMGKCLDAVLTAVAKGQPGSAA